MVYTDSWYFQQNSGVETFYLIFVDVIYGPPFSYAENPCQQKYLLCPTIHIPVSKLQYKCYRDNKMFLKYGLILFCRPVLFLGYIPLTMYS